MLNDLLCEKHNISLECIGGCSAHRSNWYCPECENEEQKKANEILSGMEQVYVDEEKRLNEIAPKCHNRPMMLMEDDLDDGFPSSEWWECSVCGYTKDT